MRGFASLRTVTMNLRAVEVNDEGSPMGTVHFPPGIRIEVIHTKKGMTGFGIIPSTPGKVRVYIAMEKAVFFRTEPTEGFGARVMNRINPRDIRSSSAI